MPILIAKLVAHVVGRRQQLHSDDFRIERREVSHFKVVIFLVLEALKDHQDRSHKGFFVDGLLSRLLQGEGPEKRQESDAGNISDKQPVQKKRRSKTSGIGKQDVTANIRNVQTDVALSYEERTQGSGASRDDRRKEVLPQEQEDGPSASSVGLRAIRTKTTWMVATCTTCEKKIPSRPSNQSQQCAACQRKSREQSVAHQHAPAPTAVTGVPTTALAPLRRAPTAVMVAPTAPTYQQASNSSEIEVLQQRIRKQEVEKDGLKAMIREQRGEFSRQKSELEAARKEIFQLRARIQKLEEQI